MATHLDGFLKRWALLATILAAPLAASVPCVTSLNDSGPGSLRSCISTVTSGGTIAFNPSIDGGTIRPIINGAGALIPSIS